MTTRFRLGVFVLSLISFAVAANASDDFASANSNPAVEILCPLAPTTVMTHAALNALSESVIDVPLHQTPSGCVSQYGALKIKVQVGIGDDYNLGENAFIATINATLTTYSDMSTPLQSWTIPFSLSQNTPEQLLIKNVTGNPALVKFVKIKINSYSNPVIAAQNAIQLKAWTEEEDIMNITGVTVSLAAFTPIANQWEQIFAWTSSCTQVPAYVFQLLRIYDNEAADWSKALTINTESAATSLTISVAEGSGKYNWRVTPLGNLSGGATSPANWGTPSAAGTFNFTHPEAAMNWIYSRTFTEGNRAHEQVLYANGLQQAAQQQTRIKDDNQIVATQTVQDIIGRNAIVSLPVPAVGKDKLKYIPGLLKNPANANAAYQASDFLDPKNPPAASDFSDYYGTTANAFNQGVPRAEGYPFTQTVFAKDGSGRVREQSGVGFTHSVKGGKTVRIFYSHPSETELLRLFGKETPDLSSIQKVTTFDPNGSASVSYQTKDGKVIATALGITSAASPVDPLPSAAGATISINEEVKNSQRVNDRTIISRKPLFVESDRQLTVDYQISPSSVLEVCGNSSLPGLVAYYPMEGSLNDMSSTNNPATASGGVTLSQDAQAVMSAYTTDGINGYIIGNDVSQTDIGAGDFSVGFWVKKIAATTAGKNIAGVGKWNTATPAGTNEWTFDLSSNGIDNRVSFSIESGSAKYKVAGTADLVIGQWYHVAAKRTGNQLAIFVNGLQQSTLTIPANVVVNNLGRSLWIGRQGTSYTNAAFDDVQIYNRALSNLEIAQLLKRAPVCKTCDYKVDILLYKEGDITPVTIGSKSIESVNCASQSSVVWDPSPFPQVTLTGGVNYVLEKRITLQTIDPTTVTPGDPSTSKTYLDAHLASVENFYRTQYDAQLGPINGFLNVGNMAGLYSSLTYGSDSDGYFYPMLPVGVNGCQDILKIPVVDPCPTETYSYDGLCRRNSQTFEQFFASYYTGHATITPLRVDGKLSYVFFKNLYTNTNDHFSPTQFNTMVTNMIADNGLSCETVWKIWDEEVKGYESKEGATFEETPDPLYSFATPENNMLQSFLSVIEAKLQETLEQDQPSLPAKNICLNRPSASYPYFIKKTQLYGYFIQPPAPNSAVVAPDLLRAYRLAYYNDALPDKSHIKALMFYSGLHTKQQIEDAAIVPSGQYFYNLSSCDQYRFHTNTQIGNTGPSESVIQSVILKMRGNCGKACESRAQEFRQAIIRSIFLTTPTTKIEHYNVYLDSNLDGNLVTSGVQAMYVGVYDPLVNVTGFTIRECELDAMVDKLVQNCKNNYCNAPLTPHDEPHPDKPGFTVRVYGTDAELAALRKPLEYDFEVQVNAAGQNCSAGWDQIAANSGNTPWEKIKAFFAAASSISIEFFYDSKFKKDAAGNFYVVGVLLKNGDEIKFNNATSYFHTGGGAFVHDIFFAKFDPAGDVIWIRKHTIPSTGSFSMSMKSMSSFDAANATSGGTASVEAEFSINEDNSGGIVFIVNVFANSVTSTVEDQNGNAILTLPANFIAYTGEYDSQGNLIWIKPKLDVFQETFYALRSNGYNYIVPRDFGNFWIEKLDGAGNIVWTSDFLVMGTGSSAWSSEISFDMMTIDGNSDLYYLYRASDASGTISFKVNGTTVATYSATELTFLIKFNSSGDYQWHKVIYPNYDSQPYGAIISGEAEGVLIIPTARGGNIGPDYQFSVPATNNLIFKVNGNGAVSWYEDFDFETPGSLIVSFQEDANKYYLAHRYDWPQSRKYFVASVDKSNLTFKKALVPQFGATHSKLKTFFVNGEKLEMIFDVGNHPSTNPYVIPITPQFAVANILFGVFTPNYLACSTSKALCFRFTSPRAMSITIPSGIEAGDIYVAVPETCNESAVAIVRNSIQQQKEQFIAARVKSYRDLYTGSCGDPSRIQDKLTIAYSAGLHHFTLYYHDRAGNLIRTVPPEGVAPIIDLSTDALKAAARNSFPPHTLVTEYQYNSLGQLINEHSPDGNFDSSVPADYIKPVPASTASQVNASKYYTTSIYNDKGQLRFSANARQKKNNTYSYTKYDELGRVVEVGESSGYNENVLMSKRNEIGRAGYPTASTSQVTSTYYTDSYAGTLPTGYQQRHLRNRVSYAMLDEDGAGTVEPVTTVYSYDPHGNVEWLVQAIPGLSPVAINYEYDLISGKVIQVKHNPGKSDQFFHKYDYDASNRVVAVYTSTEGTLWERDAKYEYYKHGPLRRAVIGEDRIQGIDYTYTIHGWLKGINHQYLNITSDPMSDAGATEVSGAKNHITGRDAFGMALQYYTGDYKRTGSTFDAGNTSTLTPASTRDLYNGNIAAWASNGGGWASAAKYPTLTIAHKGVTGYRYTYDQLNRLKSSSFVVGNAYTPSGDFAATYTYTPDGNIVTAVHKGNGTNLNLDNLTYTPVPGTHRLDRVDDGEGVSAADMDIEDQNAGNYTYDPIGNLIGDIQQGTTITWTPYGKVLQVTKGTAYTKFSYDASGNRVMKKRTNASGVSTINFYVRDASGNIMAVYERIDDGGTQGQLVLTELPIYGSDRLGIFNKPLTPGADYVPPVTEMYARSLNNRQYELKDHLGNIRAVVGDVKQSTIVSNVPGSYEPKLVALSNYYPFGMDQPGRMWTASAKYRYGFNGKEKDDNGEWGQTAYDYGFRIYNPAIGKFLSVDPLTNSFPMLTPYQYASNTPIQAIDLDGLEAVNPITGEIIHMGSQTSLTGLPNSNVKLWQDLFDWEVSREYEKILSKVTDWNLNDPQRMAKASGSEVNTDYYAVTIGRMPKNLTAEDLYKTVREEFATIMDGNGVADLFVTDLEKWKSSNPTETIVLFETTMDDSPVFTSKAESNYWIFTPLSTTLDWEHPLAGHRQFGLTKNEDGTFTFYTRGVDRMFDIEHALVNYLGNPEHDWFFKQADKLWNHVMDKVAEKINKEGGEAKKTHNFSRRVNWKKDAKEGKNRK